MAFLEELEGEENKALTFDNIDPAEHGYKKLEEEFQHGLYGGQDASPKKIAKACRKLGCTRFLFVIDDVGQFDLSFALWIHESEYDKVTAAKLDALGTKTDIDPADAVTTIDVSTGTSTVKKVTAQEFIEGTAFKR